MRLLVRGRACHMTSENQIQNCLFVLSIVLMATAHVRVRALLNCFILSRQIAKGLLGCRILILCIFSCFQGIEKIFRNSRTGLIRQVGASWRE